MPGAAAGRSAMAGRFVCGTALGLLALALGTAEMARAQTIVTDSGAPGTSFMSPLSTPGLQPFWVGYVGADRGLGFQGQYLSAGGLLPITTDMLDGTWFVDARAHVTADYGQFFSNLGIGRRAYFDPLNAIVGLSGWYDYDGDAYQNYGYRYNQLGVTGEIFNPVCDVRVNGYFPVGTTSHVLNEFTQNYLLYQNGIDTALHGGDAKFSLRPAFLGPLNGYIDIGGYVYKSPVVSTFGGISTGFGVQPVPGVAINMEVNHDDLFGTTGFIRVAFGLRGSPGNSRTGNRLLEPTRRNDHIVRFNQQPEIATNPTTNAYYHVIHVDNNAPAGGNGTAEHPFNSLAAAQSASAVHDIIYVHAGDGTARNYNEGIVLKDDQTLLGSGNSYVMQTTEVGGFLLKALDQEGPVITNPAGGAVTLANDDRVGGMTITGAQFGIVGNSVNNFSMESNRIINSGVDGVLLTNFSGLAHIRNNTITDNREDGIHIFGGNANYDIRGNTVDANIRNGIFFDSANGSAAVDSNTLGENGRGNWAGLQVTVTSGAFDLEASDNSVKNNTEGILLQTFDDNATLTAVIRDNRAISDNIGDGIQLNSQAGSTINFAIVDNAAINDNGYTSGGGAAIRMFTQDAIMSGTITGNTLYHNGGTSAGGGTSVGGITQASGIQGDFNGNSITSLAINNNNIQNISTPAGNPQPNPFGDGIRLQYDITNAAPIQLLSVTNNIIQSNTGAGLIVDAQNRTVLDGTLTTNQIINNLDAAIIARTTDFAVMRLTMTNNTITGNSHALADDAVTLLSEGGRLIGIVTNNVINNNGQPLVGATATPTPVSGLSGMTSGTGVMALQILGNQIDGNGNFGVRLESDNVVGPTAPFSATLAAQIDNNVFERNGGISAVNVLLTDQAPGNRSIMLVDLTHNTSSKTYNFENDSAVSPPILGLIGIENNGLNTGIIQDIGPGAIISVPTGTVAGAIAPMLVFP
jgi:Right handed beta helix region